MSNSVSRAALMGIGACLIAAPAAAQSKGVLDGLDLRADCSTVGGVARVPVEILYERALARHGIILPESVRNSPARMAAFQDAVVAAGDFPTPATASPAHASLYHALAEFFRGYEVAQGVEVRFGEAMPGGATDREIDAARVRNFLAGDADDWLEITCSSGPASVAQGPEVANAPRSRGAQPSGIAAYLADAVVAQDLAGAQKGLANRNFATLSGKWDREAGVDSYAFEGVILFGGPAGSQRQFELRPYASLHRTGSSDPEAKEINDLTLGALGELAIGGPVGSIIPSVSYLTISGAWESDDSLESSVTRGELRLVPNWGSYAPLDRRIDCFPGGKCFFRIAATGELARVHDPGDKTALASMDDIARVGLDLEAAFHLTPLDTWDLGLTLTYGVRESIAWEDADADLFKARLAYTPSKNGHVSIGLDYVVGEDLSSLIEQEYWGLSLGYRR